MFCLTLVTQSNLVWGCNSFAITITQINIQRGKLWRLTSFSSSVLLLPILALSKDSLLGSKTFRKRGSLLFSLRNAMGSGSYFFTPFWSGLLGHLTIQGINDISLEVGHFVWHLIWNVLYICNVGDNVFQVMETETEGLFELAGHVQNGISQWLALVHKACFPFSQRPFYPSPQHSPYWPWLTVPRCCVAFLQG